MKDNSTISQDLLETVERYSKGSMPKQERLDFERKLKEDHEFNILVKDISTLILGIENQSFKEQLDVFHKDLTGTHRSLKPSRTSRFSILHKIAAVAVILIAITGFWWFSTPQNEKLYSSYFTPDPGLPTTMSTTSNYEFYDAMVNYKQGDYKTAIQKWEAISIKNDTLNYFLGVAYLAEKKEDTAITFLEKSITNAEFPLLNDAHYYLGLAYLKNDNKRSAIKHFKLSDNENSQPIISELVNQ